MSGLTGLTLKAARDGLRARAFSAAELARAHVTAMERHPLPIAMEAAILGDNEHLSDKCCVLHIGTVCVDTCFHINSNVLSIVKQCLDLGVTISHNLQSSEHINIIVAKAHQRASAILRCFVSRDKLTCSCL